MNYRTRWMAVPLLGTLTMAGCDNTDNDRLSDEALEAFTGMMSDTFGIFSLLSIELAPASTSEKKNPLNDLFACPQGGEVDYTVTSVGGARDAVAYALELNDCHGLSGSLLYEISGSFSESLIDLDISVDGTIAGACRVAFTAFNETIQADLTGGPTSLAFTINGEIASTCHDESFTCRFENDAFDTSNTSFFEQRCALD